MSDEFINRLRDDDPAAQQTPDVDRLRERVLAHIHSSNVVTLAPKRTRGSGLRFAAAAAAIVVAAGAGFIGGRAQNNAMPTVYQDTASPAVAAADGESAKQVAPTGAVGMGGVGGADRSFALPYGGNAVLKPTSLVSNTAGTADAYAFNDDGVNRKALAKAIADFLAVPSGDLTSDNGNWFINPKDGEQGNVYVGNDAMASFNGWSQERSPWSCGNDERSKLERQRDKSNSASIDQQVNAIEAKCTQQWPAPAAKDAIAAAKQAFAALDIPLANQLTFRAEDPQGEARSISVMATLSVDGKLTNLTWTAEVGKEGVFSLYGFAADLTKSSQYPVVGARDAAKRSELRKWSAFGPMPLWTGVQTVIDTERSAPALQMRDGKPMMTAYTNDITVTSAKPGLMQVYLADGSTMLMPTWDFWSPDGTTWQMLAISDEFVDWQQQPGGGVGAY